ncbi:MAG: TonB family protein [Candidatus Aminicenantes bacterium]|jgi:TonB family protein
MRKTKILIVDFDEESTLALSEYLKSEGFDISTAGDGELGLEKCKGEYPDLVIVEPMISKLHGFELCSIISHDFNGQIPVVILTKFYREEQFKIEAMSAYGASAFLSKPFKGPEILSTINDLLKEKIKQSEEKDMAEDTQNLEEYADKALDDIEVEPKMTEKKIKEDLDSEFLEPVPPAEPVQKKEEKIPDVKTQIDKMLEDTLSEFGLNLDAKAHPQRMEKSVAQTEEKKDVGVMGQAAIPEPSVTEVKDLEETDVKDEKAAAGEEIKTEEKATIPDLEKSKETNEDIDLNLKAEEAVKESEKAAVEAPEKEGSIFSAVNGEEKTKISPMAALKSSYQFLKKLPLKFIVPLVLVAAIALSASFIFRKPKSAESRAQNKTSAILPVKKSTPVETEEIVTDSSDEQARSQQLTPPTIEPSTQPTADEPKEEAGEVKTKVNEVFAAKDSTSQALDLEQVNLEEDVLTETAESTPEPLLTQELPSSPVANDPALSATPSEDSTGEFTFPEDSGITQEDEQPQAASRSEIENPPVETGDLIPLEDVDIEPEIAKRIDPKYPGVAFQRGIEGKVVINVLISESGDVIETALIKGIPGPFGFNEDCTNAVRQWKFVPAFKDGVKVKVWKTISFTFKKT